MPQDIHKGAHPKLFHYARENRKLMTDAEKVLWTFLRNKRLNGYKFRRQHPISDFIADFYCPEINLIVEVDGDYHTAIEQKQFDDGRTFELGELKVRVIRFTNREVLQNIDFVLDQIKIQLNAPPSIGQ